MDTRAQYAAMQTKSWMTYSKSNPVEALEDFCEAGKERTSFMKAVEEPWKQQYNKYSRMVFIDCLLLLLIGYKSRWIAISSLPPICSSGFMGRLEKISN